MEDTPVFYAPVRGNFARPESAKQAMRELAGDENPTFELVREPDNKWDSNAIQVHYNDEFIGYIGKEFAEQIAPMMDEDGIEPECTMDSWEATDKPVLAISCG